LCLQRSVGHVLSSPDVGNARIIAINFYPSVTAAAHIPPWPRECPVLPLDRSSRTD
jgi:hypothetical protein